MMVLSLAGCDDGEQTAGSGTISSVHLRGTTTLFV